MQKIILLSLVQIYMYSVGQIASMKIETEYHL